MCLVAGAATAGTAGAALTGAEKKVLAKLDGDYAWKVMLKQVYGWGIPNYDLWYNETVGGTEASHSTIDGLVAEMAKIGLQPGAANGTYVEDFPIDGWEDLGSSAKVVSPYTWTIEPTKQAYKGAGTGPKGVTAPLVNVGNGRWEDFEKAGDIAGKIVLLHRADPMFYGGPSLAEAKARGAVGALMDYPVTAKDILKTDEIAEFVPTLYIRQIEWDRLAADLHAGKQLQVKLVVDNEVGDYPMAHNVVGTIPGSVYPDEYIYLGCHFDHWITSAADDGAGVGSMFAIAKALKAMEATGWRPQRTIVFAAFDSEELGGPPDTWYDWCLGSFSHIVGQLPGSSNPASPHYKVVERHAAPAGAARRARRPHRGHAQHGRDRREGRRHLRREHTGRDVVLPEVRRRLGPQRGRRDLGLLAAVQLRRLAVLHGRRTVHADRLLGAGVRHAVSHDRRRAGRARPQVHTRQHALQPARPAALRQDGRRQVRPARRTSTWPPVASPTWSAADAAVFAAGHSDIAALRTGVKQYRAVLKSKAAVLNAKGPSAAEAARVNGIQMSAAKTLLPHLFDWDSSGIPGWTGLFLFDTYAYDLRAMNGAIAALEAGKKQKCASFLSNVTTMRWGRHVGDAAYTLVMEHIAYNPHLLWGYGFIPQLTDVHREYMSLKGRYTAGGMTTAEIKASLKTKRDAIYGFVTAAAQEAGAAFSQAAAELEKL